MSDYALIQIAELLAPALGIFGVGLVAVSGVALVYAIARAGSRRRMNDLEERIVQLEAAIGSSGAQRRAVGTATEKLDPSERLL